MPSKLEESEEKKMSGLCYFAESFIQEFAIYIAVVKKDNLTVPLW